MTRLKNTLAEDLIAARKDIERLSDHNIRLNKEKEDLTKERGNLVIDLTGSERDNQTLNSVCTKYHLSLSLSSISALFLVHFRPSVHYVQSMFHLFSAFSTSILLLLSFS